MRKQIKVKSNFPQDMEAFQIKYCEAVANSLKSCLTASQIEELLNKIVRG